jgi:nitroreductase
VDPEAYVQRYAAADKASTGLGRASADWPVPYWFVDGGAAVMGMLLAAEAAGLGALFFGQFDHEPAVAAEFGVPGGLRSVGTVALGWPAPGGRDPARSAATGRPVGPRFVHDGGW